MEIVRGGPADPNPAAVDRFVTLARDGTVWLARIDGQVAGSIILSTTAPACTTSAPEPELYVTFLVTARACAGRGVGAALLAHARSEARAAGIGLLRVDCYDGDDHKLVAYYESQGFTPVSTFIHPAKAGPWPGRILEQRVQAGRRQPCPLRKAWGANVTLRLSRAPVR